MKFLKKLFKYIIYLLILTGVAAAAGLAFVYQRLEPDLPSIEILRDVRLQVPLRVYSREHKLIAEFGEKRRIPLTYDEIPETVRQSFLAAEDDRFFQHPGVDYQGLLRAAVQLALTGERRQGGSTITMQVARNFFLSREKTYTRKLKEILLSLRIERELSKEEILALYLNKIYLGSRAYGIGAAAQVYYGRTVDELELPQIAMIAGLPKAPSTTNPIANPKRALERRNYVLGRMRDLGFISAQEFDRARGAPVSARLHRTTPELVAPYVAEMVRGEMVERYGEEAYTRGLNVITSLDSRLQTAASAALRSALQTYDARHGYRGVAGHMAAFPGPKQEVQLEHIRAVAGVAGLERALVLETAEKSVQVLLSDGARDEIPWDGLKWARRYIDVDNRGPGPKKSADILRPGDLIYTLRVSPQDGEPYWRLAQIPAVEGAFVSLDPVDGAVRALIGGYDFYRSKFNRVIQARRQPGSGFKAFVYSAALEAGFTPASLLNDAPLVVRNAGKDGDWRPENYSGKWFGPTRLRVGLYKSRNLISIRLLRAMGVKFVLDHTARFGFDTNKLPRNLTLALGSGEVTPLQMARGYSVLANGGYLVDPYFIERVDGSREGVLMLTEPRKVCLDCPEPVTGEFTAAKSDAPDTLGAQTETRDETPSRHAPRVLSVENQYLMVSMMQDVIRRGTGTRARVLGREDLAGKTGTSNDQRDAWFNGFQRSLVAIAWVGFDSFRPLGRKEVGGRVALPAWIDFMRVALKDVPEQGWDLPEGIVTVRIDPKTGKRAPAGTEGAVFEVFRKDRVPRSVSRDDFSAPAASGGSGSETLTQELF